ncbi:MAG: pyridoxamine 5'-phosphate oxidase family protein [Chloroflexi bacterium]|nr:pyridoxamine 5'-phosphate oxidase family protein [Chloroflexota bacterium]
MGRDGYHPGEPTRICLPQPPSARIFPQERRCATARLPEEAKKIISSVQPAFVATASKNGKPNASPKGSLRVLDDEHVAFAEIASPKTLANLKENPQVAIMVFDPATWGGCRIEGKAEILDSGDLLESFKAQFAPLKMKVRYAIKVAVEEVSIMPPMKTAQKG